MSHRSAPNCYYATEPSLLQRAYLQPARIKPQPQANSIFLIARAEDNIRKDWPRNLSLHPSLNYVKFSNSPQNFLWPEEPSALCSLTARAGL